MDLETKKLIEKYLKLRRAYKVGNLNPGDIPNMFILEDHLISLKINTQELLEKYLPDLYW